MKHKRRVLSLDPAGLLWGSERALLDFLGEIPGYDSACCCPAGVPLIGKLKEGGIVCYPYFQANLHLRSAAAKAWALLGLLRAIRRFRPDILHVNQAGATRIALAACRIFCIPCVAHVRLQEDVEYLNNLNPAGDFLKGLVAISQPIADLIQDQPNLQKIPCRLLIDAFRPSWQIEKNDAIGDKFSVDWDFICVGRISESKGQEVLIRALHLLAQRGLHPRIAFVGEVNEAGRHLQSLTKKLGLEQNIEFVGHQDEVNPLLARSKWLICPSRYEPLGRVLFEAWDVGIPVIAGEFSGGAAASITNSGGGLLFSEWTPESLARTLAIALQTNHLIANETAKMGRSWMLESTCVQNYSNMIAGIFDVAVTAFTKKI
jgi:glycosyltransferase involved in cell wall biosynthesis